MRRRATIALLLPLLATAFLTACGSSSSKQASGLPTVSGGYGSKPTFTFPSSGPPTTLKTKVLHEGTGAPVGKGELLVGDYLGQVWKGKVFDNSYDRKAASGFPIGAGKVIKAWDEVLVGVKAGSRILMTVPPSKGYGPSGNSGAGIKGTDTLVFVVDVVGSYGAKSSGDPKAAPEKASTPGITITGALGAAPRVAVKKGTKAPAKPATFLLAKGKGPAVGAGLLVAQYSATAYTGAVAGSTWIDGAPVGVTVSPSGLTSAFDVVRGFPLGSRVLLELPGSGKEPAVAVVVDLVAQPKTAAQSG